MRTESWEYLGSKEMRTESGEGFLVKKLKWARYVARVEKNKDCFQNYNSKLT